MPDLVKAAQLAAATAELAIGRLQEAEEVLNNIRLYVATAPKREQHALTGVRRALAVYDERHRRNAS